MTCPAVLMGLWTLLPTACPQQENGEPSATSNSSRELARGLRTWLPYRPQARPFHPPGPQRLILSSSAPPHGASFPSQAPGLVPCGCGGLSLRVDSPPVRRPHEGAGGRGGRHVGEREGPSGGELRAAGAGQGVGLGVGLGLGQGMGRSVVTCCCYLPGTLVIVTVRYMQLVVPTVGSSYDSLLPPSPSSAGRAYVRLRLPAALPRPAAGPPAG